MRFCWYSVQTFREKHAHTATKIPLICCGSPVNITMNAWSPCFEDSSVYATTKVPFILPSKFYYSQSPVQAE